VKARAKAKADATPDAGTAKAIIDPGMLTSIVFALFHLACVMTDQDFVLRNKGAAPRDPFDDDGLGDDVPTGAILAAFHGKTQAEIRSIFDDLHRESDAEDFPAILRRCRALLENK
jgi:hypothetical protein